MSNADLKSAEQNFYLLSLKLFKNTWQIFLLSLQMSSLSFAFTTGKLCPCWYQRAELELARPTAATGIWRVHCLELGVLQRGRNSTYHCQCHHVLTICFAELSKTQSEKNPQHRSLLGKQLLWWLYTPRDPTYPLLTPWGVAHAGAHYYRRGSHTQPPNSYAYVYTHPG